MGYPPRGLGRVQRLQLEADDLRRPALRGPSGAGVNLRSNKMYQSHHSDEDLALLYDLGA